MSAAREPRGDFDDAARPARGAAFGALAVFAGAFVLAAQGARSPAPIGDDAPPQSFSAARALRELEWIARAPHPVGSAEHERVRARLVERCRELGLDVEEQETLAAGHNGTLCAVRNVIARLDGRDASARAIALCAHYDSVPAGPGAGDDGAGVAALLEVARALRAGPELERPVWLVFTDGEEVDLSGATAFVREPRFASAIEVVVNLEARGTSGASRMFETSAGNADLIDALRRADERPSATSVAYEIYSRMPNDTDMSVFKSAGIAGLNFAFIDGFRRYHTPLDDLAHLDRGSLQHHGDHALGLARELGAARDIDVHADRDRVYFDLCQRTLVVFSRPVAIAIAAITAAAALFTAVRRTRARALLAAFGAHALAIALAALVAHLAVSGLALARGVPDPWAADPIWTRAALLASTCACACFAYGLAFARRAGTGALAASAWISAAMLALALAIWVPGASYLALAPAVGATLVAWLAVRDAWRAFAPGAAALVVGAPIVLGLELAFEFRVPAALGAIEALLLAAFAPAFAADPLVRRASAGAAIVAAAALALSFTAPAHDADSPARVNLVRVDDPAAGEPRLAALSYDGPLPRELEAAAPFERDARPLVRWFARAGAGRSTPLVAAPLAPPRVEVVDESREGDLRVVRARVASVRGATRFVVDVPRGSRVRAATWRGHRVTSGFRDEGALPVSGVGDEGFELEIETPAGSPIELRILEVRHGAPAGAEHIVAARPAYAAPVGTGDASIVVLATSL